MLCIFRGVKKVKIYIQQIKVYFLFGHQGKAWLTFSAKLLWWRYFFWWWLPSSSLSLHKLNDDVTPQTPQLASPSPSSSCVAVLSHYGTLIMASHHVIMTTSAVIRSLVLCKSLVTPSLVGHGPNICSEIEKKIICYGPNILCYDVSTS